MLMNIYRFFSSSSLKEIYQRRNRNIESQKAKVVRSHHMNKLQRQTIRKIGVENINYKTDDHKTFIVRHLVTNQKHPSFHFILTCFVV